MSICGIIAEYNPFHLGHARHLAETRRRLGGDAVLVCAMSGNFVQRGDFALLDKYERAAMAVECGADLAVELPLAGALSSAEGFARSGAAMLAALGCTYISFGAERDELPLLERAAKALRDPRLPSLLAESLRAGYSYAAAMQHAAGQLDPEAAALLSEPNNTLGISYCAALEGTGIRPLVIRRAGAGHDSGGVQDGLASASFLRARITEDFLHGVPAGEGTGWREYMPEPAAKRLVRALDEGRAPMLAANCDTAMLAHLRRLDRTELERFAPVDDGFSSRLLRAVREGCTFGEVCEAARTRRFPLARIRRTLLRAYLDLPDALSPEPQYIRVLALGQRGAEVLRGARLPVITKPAAERRLPENLQPALRRDALADSLYALAAPGVPQRSAQTRWRRTPFVLK